jgi:hypothetical protein
LGVLTPEGFGVDAVSWRDFWPGEEEDSDVAPWGPLVSGRKVKKNTPLGGLFYWVAGQLRGWAERDASAFFYLFFVMYFSFFYFFHNYFI